MFRTRPGVIAVFLAGALAITSCSADTPNQAPSAAPLTAAPSTAEPAPTAQQTEANIVEVDPEVLAGLAGLTTPSETSLDQHYFAVWPELSSDPAFTEATKNFATTQVKEFVADYPASSTQVAEPDLGVSWRLVASSPSLIGIVQDVDLNAGGSASRSWRSLWYDLKNQQVIGNADLISDPEALTTAVVTALEGIGDPSYLEGDFAADRAPLLAFTAAGELVVGFDDGQAGPMSQGRIYATLSADTTNGLLSEQGKVARDSAVKPTMITPESTIEPPAEASTEPGSAEPVDETTSETSSDPSDETGTEPTADETGTDETGSDETGAPTAPSSKPTTKPTTKPSKAPVTQAPRTGRPDCSKLKCVALTFDDGPSTHTKKLVADLKALNAPATFYVLGSQVDTYPSLTKQMVANGNELGVHTWSHPELTKKSSSQVSSELSRTKKIIVSTTGVTPATYRPPYGATNATVRSIAGQQGMAEIMWTVDTMDWRDRNSSIVASRAINQAKPGSIILMHDIHKTTVASVPQVVKGLRAKGYTLVTVSDLLGSPQPGKRYYRR